MAQFPSWLMCIGCDCCGKVQMVNETHMKRGERRIRDILGQDAPLRLPRPGREGGVAHRDGGRQQPASAQDRADGWAVIAHLDIKIEARRGDRIAIRLEASWVLRIECDRCGESAAC